VPIPVPFLPTGKLSPNGKIDGLASPLAVAVVGQLIWIKSLNLAIGFHVVSGELGALRRT
jgi:hypothetical protein